MSKKTNTAEEKYYSHELEVLAIINALKKFRVYLLGQHFKIVTDSSAFQITMQKKDLITRIARSALLLEEFVYELEHRAGSRMKHVDDLSRYPVMMQKTFDNPIRIISDRGSAFTSKLFNDYCDEENIQHLQIATGVPRGNVQVERIHRTLIPVLTKLSLDDSTKWYKYFDRLQRILNSTICRSTKWTPFELLAGTKMRNKEDILIKDLLLEEMAKELLEQREFLRNDPKKNIETLQSENRKTYNRRRKKASLYKEGDLVAIQRTQFRAGLKGMKQFIFSCIVKQTIHSSAASLSTGCLGRAPRCPDKLDNPIFWLHNSITTLFWGMFGMSPAEAADVVVGNKPGEDVVTHDFTEWIGRSLYAIYELLMIIALVNTLIAILSNTFQRVVGLINGKKEVRSVETYLCVVMVIWEKIKRVRYQMKWHNSGWSIVKRIFNCNPRRLVIEGHYKVGLIAENNSTSVHEIPGPSLW
ncbi:retrovirus-related Pol polyprotein from transposon 17.6 [Trichonephila clavipes]|nr:retrovirus-related Pol polyprotein from transposon 17.6 [Trichonephila clavipes]